MCCNYRYRLNFDRVLCGFTAPTSITASSTRYLRRPSVGFGSGRRFFGVTGSMAWYAGGCGSGYTCRLWFNHNVVPNVDTEYHVRAEGACNNTACDSNIYQSIPTFCWPYRNRCSGSRYISRWSLYYTRLSAKATVIGGTLEPMVSEMVYVDDSFGCRIYRRYIEFDPNTYIIDNNIITLYVRGEKLLTYGLIPAPCVEITNYAEVDISDMLFEHNGI